jgi:hypothetical protein
MLSASVSQLPPPLFVKKHPDIVCRVLKHSRLSGKGHADALFLPALKNTLESLSGLY